MFSTLNIERWLFKIFTACNQTGPYFPYVRQTPIPMNQKSSNRRVPKQETWAAFCAGLYWTAGDDGSKDTLPENEMNDEHVVSDCVSSVDYS